MSDYPQMPPLTPEEIDTFLRQPLLAKISSLNEDGTIHIAPLLFGYDKGDLVLGTRIAHTRFTISSETRT